MVVTGPASQLHPPERPRAGTVFPGEQYQAPRSWAEQAYPKLIYCNEVDRGDLEVLDTCFVDDATLTDDGRTYRGRAEILAWRKAAGRC
jgi:hypothetical protein